MPDDHVPMGPELWLRHARAGMATVRSALVDAHLDARVPACPGWDLRALADHVGNVHRWVRGAILEGHPDTPEVPAPRERAGLLEWYDAGVADLLDLLGRTDPEAPCWNFGPKPRTARFWFRRQAHENAVHAYDAQEAAGRARPVDPELAADGVDEVVTMFFPRQVRLGRIAPLASSLAVRSDSGGRWVLASDGTDGLTLADAEVSGPAEALYLLLWRRIGLDDPRLVVDGDRAAAEAVLGTAIVP